MRPTEINFDAICSHKESHFSNCLHPEIDIPYSSGPFTIYPPKSRVGFYPKTQVPPNQIPWKGRIYRCLYCAGFTHELRCPSCGAPINLSDPKTFHFTDSHTLTYCTTT